MSDLDFIEEPKTITKYKLTVLNDTYDQGIYTIEFESLPQVYKFVEDNDVKFYQINRYECELNLANCYKIWDLGNQQLHDMMKYLLKTSDVNQYFKFKQYAVLVHDDFWEYIK